MYGDISSPTLDALLHRLQSNQSIGACFICLYQQTMAFSLAASISVKQTVWTCTYHINDFSMNSAILSLSMPHWGLTIFTVECHCAAQYCVYYIVTSSMVVRVYVMYSSCFVMFRSIRGKSALHTTCVGEVDVQLVCVFQCSCKSFMIQESRVSDKNIRRNACSLEDTTVTMIVSVIELECGRCKSLAPWWNDFW